MKNKKNISSNESRRVLKSFFFILFSLFFSFASAPQALAQSEAKPGVRWWWFGSAVDEANLRYNLDALHKAGVGTVEITPIYGIQGNEKNELQYLSPEWMRALRITEDIAKEDSIEVDLNNGTGWPFGGPWVPLDETACKVVFVDTIVSAKTDVNKIVFKIPSKEKKYAKLAAVRTFQVKVPSTIAKSGQVVDKTRKRVIALYVSRTGQMVKRAAPGGEGYVIDHFDSTAVAHYLHHIDSAFEATHTPYPHTFFNDSYEVYGADWTPTLLREFKARRGYDLLDSLDKLVDRDTQTVVDYRETLSDMLYHNFTQQWVAWAHSHGAIVRNQAHGSPANLLDLYGAVDIPEIEGFGLSNFGIKGLRKDPGFTRKNFSDVSMLKYASSAAHVMGKKYTSSETFTWLTEHFRTSLSQMKPDMDLMFTCGVNHMFFHGTPYSPKDARWPGWQFYASVNMSPTNSTWRDAPYLMKYIERCQKYLQWGKPDNDFLVRLPIKDMWKKQTDKLLMQFDIHSMDKKAPEFIKLINDIDRLGFDCDYISDRQLAKVHKEGNWYVTEGGTRYRGIIDPSKPLDEAELSKLAKPEEMKTRLHLRAIRRSHEGGYHYFIANLTPNDVDDYVTLAVDWKSAKWYNPLNGEEYEAETKDGKEGKEGKEGIKQIKIKLKSGESRILITSTSSSPTPLVASPQGTLPLPGEGNDYSDKQTTASHSHNTDIPLENTDIPLDGPWTLSFLSSAPKVTKTWKLDKVQTWETLDDDSVKVTMGTGVYTTMVKLDKQQAKQHWMINLGDVRESARVYINGNFIGCAWSVPYILDCKDFLHKGKNEIRIEVTNLPANRIADMDRRGVKWRIMKDINVVDLNYKGVSYGDWKPVKSGLNSVPSLVH